MRRISDEAQMYQEIEDLKATLREKNAELASLKKHALLQKEETQNGTWEAVTTAVHEGVSAGLELFTFPDDEEYKNTGKFNRPPTREVEVKHKRPVLKSSKSYG